MDITRENFEDQYGVINELLESCLFVSIDEEMTGIFSTEGSRNRRDDNCHDRYEKMAPVASKYSILQFGLCIFNEKYVNGKCILEASPFNIYVFPNNSNRDIVMSASTVDFLRKNNMDFQSWISKGVTFTDAAGEEYIKNKFLSPPSRENPLVLTAASDLDYFNRNITNLKEWLISYPYEPFSFEKCNRFLRRALYEYIDDNYPLSRTYTDDDGRVVVQMMKEEEVNLYRLQKQAESKANVDKALGFRRLFKDLKECGKPVIGHNCLFDFLFMMKSFESSLPESFTQFKALFNSCFPRVFDTKYISSSGLLGRQFRETKLDDLYAQFRDIYQDFRPNKSPVKKNSSSSNESNNECKDLTQVDDCIVQCHPDFTSFVKEDAYHNAGFDAYCTGFVFACELKSFYSQLFLPAKDFSFHEALKLMSEVAANKLYFMQSMFYMDLNIQNEDGIRICTDLTFHISGFDPKTDVVKDMEKQGLSAENVDIHWIDLNSFFLVVKSNEDIRLKLPFDWKVVPFDEFFKNKAAKRGIVSVDSPTSSSSSSSSSTTLFKAIATPLKWISSYLSSDKDDDNDAKSNQTRTKRARIN